MTDPAAFTRTAAAMVAENDRRVWVRALLRHIRDRALRVGIAWSALVIAGVVLWLLPVNMRMA